jgi:tetratricopeptide (TPR) repeat protein
MATRRQLRDEKLRSLFSNRVDELDLFKDFLQHGKDYGLLHVMGIGGVGKTALLEAFGSTCDEQNIPWSLTNVGDQELPVQLVKLIFERLTKTGQLSLPSLQTELTRYEQLDQKVRTAENIPSEILSVILIGMTKESQDRVKDSGQHALGYLKQVLGEDLEFYLNPVSRFTNALKKDLGELSSDQRVCLMFDRYERVSPYLDEWIRRDLFADLQDNILVVTSGRQKLPAGWQEWIPVIETLEVKPLTDEHTERLVRLRGITQEGAVQEIVEFAGGLPLAATMAADLLKESGATRLGLVGVTQHLSVVGQLVQKLTEEAPEDLRSWLEQCSIVRWFNEDTLERFVGINPSEVAKAYARLGQLSFVQPHAHGLALHDLVREFISEDLARRAGRRYSELHQKAAGYYRQLMGTAKGREAQPLAVELVYHLLRLDEDEGIRRLRELFDNATDFSQFDFSAALLETAKGIEFNADNRLWLEYFQAILWQQRNVNVLKAARMLEALITRPEIEQYPEVKARIAGYLSIDLWYLAEFPAALRYGQLGLELSRKLDLPKFRNRALEAVGLTENRLGRFEAALATTVELLNLARESNDQMGEAWALNNLGYFSWHAGKWTNAERYLLKCQSLLTELGNPYAVVYPLCHLGLVYIAVGRLDGAESVLMKSLKISEDERNLEIQCKTLQNLTDLSREQGRFDEALAYIDRALKISHEFVHPFYDTDALRRRGDVLLAMNKLDEAVTQYMASLDLARKLEVKYTEMRILVSLQSAKLRGWNGEIPFDENQVTNVCLQMSYFHLLSKLRFAEAISLLVNENLAAGSQAFYDALVFGVLYNRYWLYNQLKQILKWSEQSRVSGKKELGRQVLEHLMIQWNGGTYQNQKLEDLETRIRSSEPGLVPLPPITRTQLEKELQNF